MKSELTSRAVILGVLLSVVFGAANAYLGLKVGMTVSASIPAAVVSMAILRGVLKRGTIRENNIVQTIASAGESLAAGVIFTIPALILLEMNPSQIFIFSLSLTGGILGVILMIPLRRYLIEEEHRNLPYPEGTACAEVLSAGEEGGKKAKLVFSGLAVGGISKFFTTGFKVFSSNPSWIIKPMGTLIGFDTSPALLGVGYILGIRISSLVLAGGVIGWFVLIPIISYVSSIPSVNEASVVSIWSDYIRYIGAGAVLMGGVISLLKSAKAIRAAFSSLSRGGFRKTESGDIPLGIVILAISIIAVTIWLFPIFHIGLKGVLMIVVFSFFFVTVSARIVGIVGSSSNPVSGMTIATLLFVSFIFARSSISPEAGMVTALTIGAIVCISAAIAGDTSQDLKTGYLVGAKPWKQQIAEVIGVLSSAVVMGWVLLILHSAYGIGSKELSAPQATLMSLVVKGVFSGEMPWILIFIGIFIALTVELLGLQSLPLAVGLYLPLELSTTIFLGGLVTKIVGKKEKGILFSSGLVAGDALFGVIIAILIAGGISLGGLAHPSKFLAIILIFFLLVILSKVVGRD